MANLAFLGRGLNLCGWDPLQEIAASKGHACTVFERHEDILGAFDLGVLLGYDHIVPEETLDLPEYGFVLFHSSDLPEGRGWAPLYNTIVGDLPLTQTLLYAAPEPDAGSLIAKARYDLRGDETEREVRRVDDALTLALLDGTLDDILAGEVEGVPQDGTKATWWERRRPEDSAISVTDRIVDVFDHLRALPASAPAFFEHRGRRFYLELTAEDEMQKPLGQFELERYY